MADSGGRTPFRPDTPTVVADRGQPMRVDDDATAEVMGGIVPGAAGPCIWASNPVQNRAKFTPNSGFMRGPNK